MIGGTPTVNKMTQPVSQSLTETPRGRSHTLTGHVGARGHVRLPEPPIIGPTPARWRKLMKVTRVVSDSITHRDVSSSTDWHEPLWFGWRSVDRHVWRFSKQAASADVYESLVQPSTTHTSRSRLIALTVTICGDLDTAETSWIK